MSYESDTMPRMQKRNFKQSNCLSELRNAIKARRSRHLGYHNNKREATISYKSKAKSNRGCY